MEFIENFKLGALEGMSALVVLGAIALTLLVVLIVLIVNGAKAIKERKDAKESAAEDAFYAEYGVTGEEVRLNEQLAAKRERLRTKKDIPEVKWKVVEKVVKVNDGTGVNVATNAEPQIIEVVKQEEKYDFVPMKSVYDDEVIYNMPPAIFDDSKVYPLPMYVFDDSNKDIVFLEERPDEEDDIVYLEEYEEPASVVEKQPEPVEEKVEEPKPEPVVVAEEPKAVEPVIVERDPLYPLPINENLKDEPYYTPSPVIEDGREEDWSHYNGNFAGFYYDPYAGCYRDGYAPRSLVRKLVEKQNEYNETHPNAGKKFVVKRISPPYMPLTTPKNERKELTPTEGFDASKIFGQYVIEHTTKEDGTEEYYYTLYSSKGDTLYESDNYSTLDYCKRGIKRFKAHVALGLFSINASKGKFYYVLTRKQYTHKGMPKDTFEDATASIKQLKCYYGTDVVVEQ